MEGVLFGIGMFVITFVVGAISLGIKILFKSGAIYPILVMIVFSMADKGIDSALFNRNLVYFKNVETKTLLFFIITFIISMIPITIKTVKTLKIILFFIKDVIGSIAYKISTTYKKILKKE